MDITNIEHARRVRGVRPLPDGRHYLAVILLGMVSCLAVPAVVTAQESRDRFAAIDVFGGVIPAREAVAGDTPDKAWSVDGWEGGASVRWVRWFGVAGSFGRHTIQDLPTHHFLAGTRFMTPYVAHAWYAGRGFGHVLGGVARASSAARSDSGAEWVVGGGFDLVVLRLQVDYVRLNLSGLPRNNRRVFIGGVVPLCFRGCGEWDGFNLSVGGPR